MVADEDPGSHPYHLWGVRIKAVTDSLYAEHSIGSFDFQMISYRSSAGEMEIPDYLFRPLQPGGSAAHAALVWVHGGVHGTWEANNIPFVREAIERGYVVIAPEYRGSTGYGAEHYEAIDYGGYEVDDVVSAVDYLRAWVPEVDPDRIAVMGWSHGGLIAAQAVFREQHPFRAAIAIAPVSNLIFRLSYKGPAYQALFAKQVRIDGLPHERQQVYVERSPVYQVNGLQVPMMVHVATNDADVDFVESEMFIHALAVKKPDLAETMVYEDPPGGHFFSRLVDGNYRAIDSPAMQDSWSRTWAFLERHLGPAVVCHTGSASP
jgi:dipeptidyl aminopeptidase/acylaminoacyl peptidase